MARRARIDGGADLRPPSARAGARARRRVLCGVVALGVVFAPSPGFLGRARPRFAAADAIDDARTRFVEAGPSAWPDRVAELAKDPGRLGAVVGPLLRDRDPRRAKAGAFCAAWLCDRPQAGGRVTLEDDILRRAARDPAFVADLRGFVAPEGAGFARLLAVARELLGATGADASLVASAAWILRYETTASNARELLDVWADDGVDASVRGAAAESLFALLGATFRDVGEARSFFAANQGRPLFEWVRDLSAAKDRPDAPLFLRLLSEVRRNLERLHTPDELRPYLLESEAPWPEVRLLAARRTAQLEGEAEPEAWVPLFVEAVSTESDVETLTTLLESFDRLGVAANAAGSELATKSAKRLEERPAPVDALAVRFLAILGRLGTPAQLHRAFATLAERRASSTVLAAWLDAAASRGGCGPDVRELHRRRRAAVGADDVGLRVRAIEALAKGVAASPGAPSEEARQSGAFLVEVLTPSAGGVGPAFAPGIEERAAAARGLEAFPSPGAVAGLEARAVDPAEDVGLARLCASVLGRLAAKGAESDDALDALVRVARAPGTSAARVSAVDDLSRLLREATTDDRRRLLGGGLRDALGRSAPLEVRRAAARAAALVGDAGALAGVFALVVDDLATPGVDGAAPAGPDSGRWAADRLVRAVAARDAESDEAIARECRDLLDRGPAEAEASIALAEAAADAGGGRPVLQALRAMLLRRRARAADASLDESVEYVERARRVLTSALRGVSDADRGTPAWVRLAALDEHVETTLLHLRVQQLASIPDDGAFDARRLEIRRGLEPAVRSALERDTASRALETALVVDRETLERLRASASADVRRGAEIDSARAELLRGGGASAGARARLHLAEARRLEPTPEEALEIERIEASLFGDGSPPSPK